PRDGSRNGEQAERLDDNQRRAELRSRKEILFHPANQIADACVPAHGNGVLRDGYTGAETGQLDRFPKHDVVNHFQSQAAMRAAGLVDGAFDHLKGADTDISARTRIAHLVRVDGHYKREAEEGEEHFFPETNHDDIAEEREMVELAITREGHGAAKRVRLEAHIGVGK